MISQKIKNVLDIPSSGDYYRAEMGNEFPIRNYIIKKYGYAPCFFNFESSFDFNVLDFFLKKGKLINFYANGKLENIVKGDTQKYNGGFFWFSYKDIYVKLHLKNFSDISSYDSEIDFSFENKKNDKKTFNITICAPANVKNYYLEDFLPFVLNDTESVKVHLFIKNQYGEYNFEPISINLPDNLDLETNYGKAFLEIDKKVKDRLLERPNGLFMFHGAPGTGKTTYIKYLASQIKRDFIYIPTSMIEYFTSDPNCLHTLIQKPNSVIILEDAEKAILKRLGDGMDSSAVSSLLNLSDGILSDILKTSVIITYNCPKQDVDDALKRKGRLQIDYEFTELSIKDSIKLAKTLNFPKDLIEEKIIKPMSLSEIYNLEKETEFYGETKKPEQKRIGFGV
jgi:hypothetical protein